MRMICFVSPFTCRSVVLHCYQVCCLSLMPWIIQEIIGPCQSTYITVWCYNFYRTTPNEPLADSGIRHSQRSRLKIRPSPTGLPPYTTVPSRAYVMADTALAYDVVERNDNEQQYLCLGDKGTSLVVKSSNKHWQWCKIRNGTEEFLDQILWANLAPFANLR